MNYSSFFKNNKLAFWAAAAVGIICIAPQIIFRISLAGDYRGIYTMQTANEIDYLGRMQEIKDGHFTLSSVPFLEYKGGPSLMPPNILELMTAGLSSVFGVSLSSIVILSKFLLPALLFLLVYFFIRRLSENRDFLSSKINAIAGGLMVSLGYDLIDYRSVWNYLRGVSAPNDFLIWTRPFNPILGSLLIFSFLLIAWSLYKNGNRRYAGIFLAGLILALAISSYFFTAGIILSLMGVLFLAGLFMKKYGFAKNIFWAGFIGLILSLPYFYNIFLASKSVFYQESAARLGLFLTHQPVLNKFLIFSLLIFSFLSLLYKYLFSKDKKIKFFETGWWVFSFALIIAGFVALNQQIITGRTIWYYHFVQYTIPLALAALFIIFYNVAASGGKKLFYIWTAAISLVVFSSLLFGVYVQASTYQQSYSFYKDSQRYGGIFSWINQNAPKDCVILTEDYGGFLNRGVLAFTHCNNYSAMSGGYLMPFERSYHDYFTSLRLKGIKSGEIADYFKEKRRGEEAATYLYGDEGLSYGALSPSFLSIKNKLIADYEEFLKKDLKSELGEHKLDYIITTGGLPAGQAGFSDEMKNLIRGLKLVYSSGEFYIYSFK